MDGPDHYCEAERRKGLGDDALENAVTRSRDALGASALIANAQAHYTAAQAHATLALAAATIECASFPLGDRGWSAVLS